MARFKTYDYRQRVLLPVSLEDRPQVQKRKPRDWDSYAPLPTNDPSGNFFKFPSRGECSRPPGDGPNPKNFKGKICPDGEGFLWPTGPCTAAFIEIVD